MVTCAADPAHAYTFEDGILRLAAPETRALLDTAAAERESICRAAGRTTPDEEAFKRLPRTGLGGFPPGYWAGRTAATALLWRYLEADRRQRGGLPVGPMGEAAIIGAGLGWLAYGLDVAGYTTLALEENPGPVDGLAAYPIARYCRVQCDLGEPPLAPAALDLLIYQQGLPDDDPAGVMTRAPKILRKGGLVVIMDPRWPVNGAPAEDIELHYAQVCDVVSAAGLEILSPPRRSSWRGRLADAVGGLTGRSKAVAPLIVARA